jgi:hypothetical protein
MMDGMEHVRHRMTFELNSRQNIGQQIRQVARRQLDKALNALSSRDHTARSRDEFVHAARKRLK